MLQGWEEKLKLQLTIDIQEIPMIKDRMKFRVVIPRINYWLKKDYRIKFVRMTISALKSYRKIKILNNKLNISEF